MPASPTSSSRTGASAARARTCCSLFAGLNKALDEIEEARILVRAAAADPGHRQCRRRHHADRAARRQLRSRQAAERRQRRRSQRRDAVQHPARDVAVPRRRAAIHDRGRPREGADAAGLGRPGVLGARPAISARPMSTSSTSSAAPSRSTCRPTRSSGCAWRTSRTCSVRNKNGDMIPLGTLVNITPTVGAVADQPLQSLSVRDSDRRMPARGVSTGQTMTLMEEIAARTLPPGIGLRMDRDVVPGEDRRQSDVHRVRARDAAGLSRAGRPVRKLVRAGRR